MKNILSPKSEYSKTTLSNGLQIVTVSQDKAPSVSVMVLVGVGSRYENKTDSGIAHFIEHNVFKGTKRRNQRNQISEEIESLGGLTEAATGQEYTYYWVKAASSQSSKIIDIVTDISLNMTFPVEDLEIERGNVIEEINMYDDDPPRRVFQNFMEFIWDQKGVGRRISGTIETVKSFGREQMLDFVHRNYVPNNTIVIVSGEIDESSVVAQLNDVYEGLSIGDTDRFERYSATQERSRVIINTSGTSQTHLCLGVKTFGRTDKRRYTMDLMTTILGRGMGSRLFKVIRNELGLAYYVGSGNYEFEETGIWFARAGIDSNRAKEGLRAIHNEFVKLTQERVTEPELFRAKEYLKGRTLLGVETSDELGEWYGFQFLLEKEILSPFDYIERIDSITGKEIQQLAQEMYQENQINLALDGPMTAQESNEYLDILQI